MPTILAPNRSGSPWSFRFASDGKWFGTGAENKQQGLSDRCTEELTKKETGETKQNKEPPRRFLYGAVCEDSL
jgi:hypothetical protein